MRTPVATLVLAALAGCASCDHVPAGAVTDCNAQIVPGGAAIDLLFVIDDSGSMTEEQDALASNLAGFMDQLLGSAIPLDVHVGVTNTSVEDYVVIAGTTTGYGRLAASFPGAPGTPYPQGTLVAIDQDAQGAGLPGHFTWGSVYDPGHLTSTWGGPRLLASGATSRADLARDFKANVRHGTWGSSREQPLSAMRRALQKASCPGPNCGFLRDGARLAVVIVTDEDDCSGPLSAVVTNDGVCHDPAYWGYLDPLADYADYLDTTVGGKPIVAVIAGYDGTPLAPALCSGAAYGTTTAAYAKPSRLDAFLDLLDPASAVTAVTSRTVKASICRPFAEALLAIAQAVIPQTMPLRQAPQDYRMMAVSVQRASGVAQPCPLALAGAPGAAGAGAIYTAAPPGGLPSLTFQGACKLGLGDRVDLRIVCAR